jgi:DNA-binding transcriptional regulator YiaG
MTDKEYVRQARHRLKLSQSQFADRLFVCPRSVLRWENGQPVPIRKVLAIQNLLELENVAQPAD